MHDKELPYTVTLSSVLNEKDVAEKVKLAIEHLHIPFCESLLMDRARLSKENAAVLADYMGFIPSTVFKDKKPRSFEEFLR